MHNIFIKPEYLNILQDIFKKHCPQAIVWAYGSRIKNDAHEGSDLDLTVTGLENCDTDILELKELIRESNIPFMVDVFELYRLPQYMQDEIKGHYVEIYPNFEGTCG